MKRVRSLHKQQGAEVVEFALTAVLLFILLFGMIEFSVALYDKAVLTNASREGARTGILFRPQPRNASEANSFKCNESQQGEDEDVRSAVCGYAEQYLISLGGPAELAISVVRSDANMPPGNEVEVTVDYSYQFLLLPGFIGTLGDLIEIQAVTSMRAE
ncbi:pilus assembly protein [Billgrantia diversa]|uniref:TadE/TadG family type IV pilus assembly protein n=1 Tax=Halomonas sp. MCCC 1A13316 TaxID=2733487 RepID=UPI0018A4DC93|nr:TadE/TadG family type IV pilus assembly protein [Halomonas sp. MCCC 1A13316]QOR38332.1 pilus assembly protein [Halomonas sp. MCCC 1A13316]